MDMTIDQQVALDEALVPHASRLRIGKSNFRLRSDITSKESTLQLVYDVLRLTPFYKASLVTADVPEIYMQEFWATATVHHHSIHFKMDNKKRIANLEYFREMMHICPTLPGQTFDDLPFEEEILTFLRFLRHNEETRRLTDVNINKLHQPWRSFTAIINKCLSGKSTSYDSLRLSQAQILWGLYHKKNVDFAYLLWEDFIYQVEHKDAKKSNEMYYPRFTKVIIHYFMTNDPLIPRRNKFGAMLPIELTNEDIKNSKGYKEYYAVSTGAAQPKTKASVRKTKSSSETTVTPQTAAAGTRLSTFTKGKQPAKASKAKSLTVLSEVVMIEAEQIKLATKRSLQQTHIYQASGSSADEGTGIIPGVPDFVGAISFILGIVQRYIDQRMNEAVKVAVQIQSDRLRDEAQAKNEEFLKNLDENIQKIIKKQDKEQVKEQVSKILSKIKKTVNEQLEAKVLTRSSNSSKTSYAVAADLSEIIENT
nr:hypothetical protein [Tanacetum cinerariifolium]